MNLLETIDEIEKNFGVVLNKTERQWRLKSTYIINSKQEIISLNIVDGILENYAIANNIFAKLTKLSVLRIHNCKVIDISFLEKSFELTELDLGSNEILEIESIKNLNNLSVLDLSSNKIKDFTPIRNLLSLTNLNISYNPFNDVEFLKKIVKLKTLVISNKMLKDISALIHLKNLTQLFYHGAFPNDFAPISAIHGLKEFYSCSGSISDLSFLANLKNLNILYLRENKITDISLLANLSNLTALHLGENKILDLKPIEGLTGLNLLNLDQTDISDISSLRNLKNLDFLILENNNITSIPQWITDFNLKIRYSINEKTRGLAKGIELSNNPLENPPLEIVKQGNESIKRYFKKIEKEGRDYIYEAKLTLVGEGSAGKTSLQGRLMDPKAPLPQEDKRTRGIKIYDWEFKTTKNSTHIAHIWDFGGQDVYYPVHRFFLTENSVFVLLASTRQSNHNFDYWIPTIYQFGGKSPIIIGQTCHDGNRTPWNDLSYYIGNSNFNIIKTQELPYHEINLITRNEGLSKIKQTIINQILNLPHYGKGVPKSWIPIRELIHLRSKSDAIISFEDFKLLCQNSNPASFADLDDIIDCAKFLHLIGIILWYYENEELKNWVILQPEWAMNAVYKIIDDADIQKRRGNIIAKDFDRLWKESYYKEKHSILKKMLEVFKIAFQKKHKKVDYIIPARLLSMSDSSRWKNDEPFLRLEYKYDFMPKGLVNQVSAELSRYIISDEQVWNNAVNFTNDDNTAQCQIVEDFYNRKINIKSKGKDARGLIILVMNALKDITDSYKGVKAEIFVPCTCNSCKNNPKPTIFIYNDLLRWSSNKDSVKVTCNESSESIYIEDLLYNVGLPINVNKEIITSMKKIIKIFLASSSELKADREQFEIFINRENKNLIKSGIFLELNIWEDFIDAVSRTRMQDEYNQSIVESDIVVSLFATKVGKYTYEEFEKALNQFNTTGKPFLYTYFKDLTLNISQIDKIDLDSKFAFEEKLKLLGHFPTSYSNIDELKYKFKMQLEKILPKI